MAFHKSDPKSHGHCTSDLGSSYIWLQFDSDSVSMWVRQKDIKSFHNFLKNHPSVNHTHFPNLSNAEKEIFWPGCTQSSKATLAGSVAALHSVWRDAYCPVLQPPKPSQKTGHNCIRCNEYNDYAASNRTDGTYCCYRCR